MPDFSMWGYRTQYVDACTLHSRLKARVADLEAGMPYIAEEDQQEALARLEADLAAGVSAGPSAMTLEQAGASFQFLPVNAYGIYAAAYESSDPGVAAVDESGTVTALSPGRAVITLRYEGPGGSRDFTCAVTCAWN